MAGSTTPADRMKRYRRRLRAGLFSIRSEISTAVVEMLIAKGWVSPEKADDPKEWGDALGRLAEDLAHDGEKSVTP